MLFLIAGVLRGLCIATCCHHRCTWQHYVNRPFFQRLGFSPDEFELISWMTGALSDAPAEDVNVKAPCLRPYVHNHESRMAMVTLHPQTFGSPHILSCPVPNGSVHDVAQGGRYVDMRLQLAQVT